MSLAFLLRAALRESRGSRGKLMFFAACLAVGVAAVVAVSGLTLGVERGIRAQARQLLAADIVVSAYRDLPASLESVITKVPGSRSTRVREMVTVASVRGEGYAPGKSQLVELKAVEEGYPFHGELKLEPSRPLMSLLDPQSAVAGPDILTRLGVSVGGRIFIGSAEYTITGIVKAEPDRIAGAFSLGPRIFVSQEGLDRAGVVQFGSRVLRKLLIKLPGMPSAQEAERAVQVVRSLTGDSTAYKIESSSDAQPALRQGLSRVDRFLSLVALLSLIVGGAGVAQTVRAWLATRLDSLAILKCLGMRPREVLALYLVQIVLLGLFASLIGALAGSGILLLVPHVLRDVLPDGWISPFAAAAWGKGLALGTVVSLFFSLPPLLEALRVPPARVLRRDVEPLPGGRAVTLLAGLAVLSSLYFVSLVQARSVSHAFFFTLGILAAAGILAAMSALLVRTIGKAPRGKPPLWLRHGLTGVARPGSGTMASLVALGLGILVVVAMALVERHLTVELRSSLPKDAPTAFLIDIQPDQWSGVKRLLEEEGAGRVDSVPMIMARLSAIDGKPVEEIAREKASGGDSENRLWALTREQRLTYADALPPDNKVVEGKLWSLPGRPELSVEEKFAKKTLGIRAGAVLEFDIQGVPVTFTVSSLRSVDWRTFGINFFWVAEPGTLDAAPQSRLAAARIEEEKEPIVQDRLARQFPNVTMIRTREVLSRIAGILEKLGVAVQFLGFFSVAAGLILLGGAVSAGSVRKAREMAVLKVLGMTRPGVSGVLASEYALTGLVAGVIGTAGGTLLAWAVVTQGFEMAWKPSYAVLTLAPLVTIVLTSIAGLAASLRAIRVRPLEALRTE